MKKLALVFVGQGSQYLNMGLDYVDMFPEFKEKEVMASKLLGYDVRNMLSSTDGKINDTRYTQPLMMLATIFAYEAFLTLNAKVDAVAGFSLGEHGAYYAAQVFNFEQIMKIVDYRAQHMQTCALNNPGKMAAIIGLNKDLVDQACHEASDQGIVVSANYNSPVQVVISGEEKAVLKAMEITKSLGAKRALELNVSGAFHSPLMKQAADQVYEFIKKESYQEPVVPLYMNTTAKPLESSKLFDEMRKQIQSPVYFEQMINQMIEDGITHFVEIGPGTVLSGLIKKINMNVEVTHLDRASELDTLKGWLIDHGFKK
jgi:[acyl-carrier-protein] S-malonyltransferase